MKSLIVLWSELARECASVCRTSTERDIKTVTSRSVNEGESFLTITLPTLGQDFQRGLELGHWPDPCSSAFKLKGGLPRFLGGFLDLVFDRSTGVLLDTPSIDAIISVRQLTLVYSKMFLLASEEREQEAMDSYVKCEQDVSAWDEVVGLDDIRTFHRISRLLFAPAFTKMDRDIHDGLAKPKHGPGATADGLRGNAKYRQKTWPARLNEQFPMWEFLIPGPRFSGELDEVHVLEPEAEIPVKVISVPKTQKTPRIIGIEPTAMQYAQQSVLPIVLEKLNIKRVGNREIDHTYLSSFLGFDDQEPNQLMAAEGSRSGDLATLDLSEASDRVSNKLVNILLSDHPHLRGAVQSSRSTRASVRGKGVISLSKFASMGSALCFPMEAMVFLTAVFVGIEEGLNTQLTRKHVRSFVGRVRIYGDDIIVPVEYVPFVIRALERFGARVGVHKSFWNGKFRESCGKEYYDGHDVSIVKLRQRIPSSRQHVSEVEAFVSFRNHLYFRGYWRTCQYLDKQIRKILKYFPVVCESADALGRHSFLSRTENFYREVCERYDDRLHRPMVKACVSVARLPKDPLDNSAALLKYFLKRGELPSFSEDHLERAGRPVSVDIKTRWVTPY